MIIFVVVNFIGKAFSFDYNSAIFNEINACKVAFDLAHNGNIYKARRHLDKKRCPIIAKYISLLNLKRSNTDAKFEDFVEFLTKNPNWPWAFELRKRMENKLSNEVPLDLIFTWFSKNKPMTGIGGKYYAKSLIHKGEIDKAKKIISETWIENDFNSVIEEKKFYREYSKYLSLGDHNKKINRLLWNGNKPSIKYMLSKIKGNDKIIAEARLALVEKNHVQRIFSKIPNDLFCNEGLLFERVKYIYKNNSVKAINLFLKNVPKKLFYPKKWWKIRYSLARNAFNKSDYLLAYKIIENHQLTSGEEFDEAEWFLGWLSLRFLNKARRAYNYFSNLYAKLETSISKSRAAYWAGRAAEKLEKKDIAFMWYKKGAKYPTTYYGQLSAIRIKKDPVPNIFEVFSASDNSIHAFNKKGLVRLIRIMSVLGKTNGALPFLYSLAKQSKSKIESYLTVALAREISPQIAVCIFKATNFSKVALTRHAYPLLPFENTDMISEKSLILSIIRKESRFNHGVTSSAGAKGLMQLMPATAKDVAKDLKISFLDENLLYNLDFNIRLGNAYLKNLLITFKGYYPLVIASYNAGLGRVNKWIKLYGDPREKDVDLVDWIESLPFRETRNYVKGVFANLLVYRKLNEW